MVRRMKRIALIALTTMVFAIAMAATASAARVTAVRSAAVHVKASVSSETLTSMTPGTNRKVLSIAKNGKFVKVKVNGQKGYVRINRMNFTEGELGNFKLTFYGGDTMTASGRTPQLNHTIAVDPRVISLGSKVYIEGYGTYYAEDTGGAIKNNIIDIFVSSELEANAKGVDYAKVYLIG